MALFPSQEWIDELVKVATAEPELVEIGKNWTYGGIVTVMEPDEKFDQKVIAYFEIDRGAVKQAKIIGNEKEVESAFQIFAKYSVWKGIVKGQLDPIQEYLKGAIKVHGDIGILFRFLPFIRKFIQIFGKIRSEFPDEK
jgi:putative sterol carrier protein